MAGFQNDIRISGDEPFGYPHMGGTEVFRVENLEAAGDLLVRSTADADPTVVAPGRSLDGVWPQAVYLEHTNPAGAIVRVHARNEAQQISPSTDW